MRMLHECSATPTHNGDFQQCSSGICQDALGCQVSQLTTEYIRGNKSRGTEGAFPMVNQIATHIKHISCCGRAMSFIDNHGYSALARWLCPPCQQTLNHVRPRSLRHIRPPLIVSLAPPLPSLNPRPMAQPLYFCPVLYAFPADSI